jgi:hypothetical protein
VRLGLSSGFSECARGVQPNVHAQRAVYLLIIAFRLAASDAARAPTIR